ncbi:MAG: kinase [Myxococcales bacterium]|nr:kinase [Myxococcales bacterium]
MTGDFPWLRRLAAFQRLELRLDENLAPAAARVYWPLANKIAARCAGRDAPLLVGLNGPQGSGKTTGAALLRFLLGELGLAAVALSIDDFYLPWPERQALQAGHPDNPYYRVSRGNPGTHDLALAHRVLDTLSTATATDSTRLPQFDKSLHDGKGDRLPPERWPVFHGRPAVILLEGWLVGAPVLPADLLDRLKSTQPEVMAWERENDPDGRYGRALNEALGAYESVWNRLDVLVVLRIPSLAKIREWRTAQERELRRAAGQGMSDEETADFVKPYLLLTAVHGRQVLGNCRFGLTDFLIEIGEDQQPWRLVECPRAVPDAAADGPANGAEA